MPKIYVCLCADTEDNHPRYMPGWKKYGTNYDIKSVRPRFDWVRHWDAMLDLFSEAGFPVTWFERVDLCLEDKALKAFKPYQKRILGLGHEIGIHIHNLIWDGHIWRQNLKPREDAKIVKESFRIFRKATGIWPVSSRMGSRKDENIGDTCLIDKWQQDTL